jgi:hypothetical protein
MADLQMTEKQDLLMNSVQALVKESFCGVQPQSVTFNFTGYHAPSMSIDFEGVTFKELKT